MRSQASLCAGLPSLQSELDESHLRHVGEEPNDRTIFTEVSSLALVGLEYSHKFRGL